MTQFNSSINNPFQLSSALPEIMASVMPDYSSPIYIQSNNYTAPSDGYIAIQMGAPGSGQFVVEININGKVHRWYVITSDGYCPMQPIARGDKLTLSGATNAIASRVFYPCKGAI